MNTLVAPRQHSAVKAFRLQRQVSRDLWVAPDHYLWAVRYFVNRRLERLLILMIASFGLLAITPGLLATSEITAHHLMHSATIVLLVAALGTFGAMALIPAARTREVSRIALVLADCGLGLLVISAASAETSLVAALAWGVLAVYIATFHNLRTLLAQQAGVTVGYATSFAVSTQVGWLPLEAILVFIAPLSIALSVLNLNRIQRAEADHLDLDTLTGLPNRETLLRDLSGVFASQQVRSHGLSLALFDLDRFKSVNDTFGHECGDLLLKELGTRLNERLSGAAALGRLGGEEFVVACVGTVNGHMLAADIAAIVGQCGRARELPIPLTPSIGVVGVAGRDLTRQSTGADSALAASMIDAADRLMYQAKKNGGAQARFGVTTPARTRDTTPQPILNPPSRALFWDAHRYHRLVARFSSESSLLDVVRASVASALTLLAVFGLATVVSNEHVLAVMVTVGAASILVALAVIKAFNPWLPMNTTRPMLAVAFVAVCAIAMSTPVPLLTISALGMIGVFTSFFYRRRDFAAFVILASIAVGVSAVFPHNYPVGEQLSESANVGVLIGAFAVAVLLPIRVTMVNAIMEIDTWRATRDPVTGAFNRHGLLRNVRSWNYWQTSSGGNEPFGVVVFDLDRFKSVNDEHGHARGDEILSATAATVRAKLDAIGAPAIIARLGGDEFAVITGFSAPSKDTMAILCQDDHVSTPSWSHCPLSEDVALSLHQVADCVHSAVAELGSGLGLTASVGATTVTLGTSIAATATDRKLAAALAEADALMYSAKLDGGDGVRVCAAPASLRRY